MVKRAGTQRRSPPIRSFVQNDIVYHTGDCVLINSGNDSAKPYIGRIKRIEQRSRGVMIDFEWFYRPEEAACGRMPFHGDKEIFASTHVDRQPSHVIEDKCNVFTYEEYTDLDVIRENDFFYRWKYDPANGTFTPDEVFIYCVCEQPHNPDKQMVGCDECKDWFHPECIGLTLEQQAKLETEDSTFLCPGCISKKDEDGSAGHQSKRTRFEA